jgi:hypothetical protein
VFRPPCQEIWLGRAVGQRPSASDVVGVGAVAEWVGVGSGDGSGVGVGVGVGVGDVGSGDADGGDEDFGGGDEEWDGAGRGELGDDDGDEAGGMPCCGEDTLLGAAVVGLVDEECLPGAGVTEDTLALPGCLDAVDGLCVPAAGCNPFWASECSSMRTAPAPSATTATAAAPAANTNLPRRRTALGLGRPG